MKIETVFNGADDSGLLRDYYTLHIADSNDYMAVNGDWNKGMVVLNRSGQKDTFHNCDNIISRNGIEVYSFGDTISRQQYIVAGKNWVKHGPYLGKNCEVVSNPTGSSITVLSVSLDTAGKDTGIDYYTKMKYNFYLGDTLLASLSWKDYDHWRSSQKNNEPLKWSGVNTRGEYTYSIYTKGKFYLHTKRNVIDSSDQSFLNIGIDEQGVPYYIKQKAIKDKGGYTTTILYTLHIKGTSYKISGYSQYDYFGFEVVKDGNWFCRWTDKYSLQYLINGKNYSGVVRYLSFDGNGHCSFFFKDSTLKEPDKTFNHYINGKVIHTPYTQIYAAVLDRNGHYAYFGLRNYYLYKIINGKESSKPISRYGVRAVPVAITTAGETLHYFQTMDSTIFYHNNTRLAGYGRDFPGISDVLDRDSRRFYGPVGTARDREYLRISGHTFMIYDGIVACLGNREDVRFFAMQFEGEKYFLLLQNDSGKCDVFYKGKVRATLSDGQIDLGGRVRIYGYKMTDKDLVFLTTNKGKIMKCTIGL